MPDSKQFESRFILDAGINQFARPHIIPDSQFREALNIRFWQQARLQVPRKVEMDVDVPPGPSASGQIYCGSVPAGGKTGAIHGQGGTDLSGIGGVISGDGTEIFDSSIHLHGDGFGPGSCEWIVTPVELDFEETGDPESGDGTFDVETYAGCSWEAEADSVGDWISIDPDVGLSSHSVQVTVEPNAGENRTGFVYVYTRISSGLGPAGTLIQVVLIEQKGIACCDGVMETMEEIKEGIKERLLWLNGSLPAVPGHDWSDPGYILNNPVEEANGDTIDTLCHLRAEGWRLWFAECDYWLTSFYLLPLDIWINTTVHPGADLTGASSVSLFNVSEYETIMSNLTWFRSVFGWNESLDITFTMGPEGGFGTVDIVRFLDTDPHVEVLSAISNQPFCDLVTFTANTMLNVVHGLMAVDVDGTLYNSVGKYGGAFDSTGAVATSDMWSCAKSIYASCAYATIAGRINAPTSTNLPSSCTVDLEWLRPNLLLGTSKISKAICGYASTSPVSGVDIFDFKSSYKFNLLSYGTGTANVYVILGLPIAIHTSTFDPLDGTPFDLGYNAFGIAIGWTPVVGTNWTSPEINFPATPIQTPNCAIHTDCTNSIGWQIEDAVAVVYGPFIV